MATVRVLVLELPVPARQALLAPLYNCKLVARGPIDGHHLTTAYDPRRGVSRVVAYVHVT